MSEKAPNPYVGPVPYERYDKRGLYGRDGDLRRLAILFIAQRIVLLYSPSGAGKTSLVQARLIPAMEMEGFEVLPVIRFNRRPVDGSEAINPFIYSTIHSLEEGKEKDKTFESFSEYWERRKRSLGNKPAVLFFDQFEEVLTIDPHVQQQKVSFFDQLGAALERDDNLWALFAIREDYLAELDPYRHLIPGKLNHSYRLELLNEGQALAAIQKPAADVEVTFADEAAGKLVGQLRRVTVRRRDGQISFEEGLFVEPVQLQVVCQSLWQELEPELGGTIGADSIRAEGHVDESLGEFYDKTVTRVAANNDIDQRDIRDWFDRQLITEQGLRGQVMGSEDLALDQGVIDDLVDAHLIRAEERRGIQWYELAHDRLVKPVKQHNDKWYTNNLSLLEVRAEAWTRSRDKVLLLQGKELKEGEAWAKGKRLKDYERSFLKTSLDRERARRNRIIAATVGFLVILGFAVGMFLLWQFALTNQAQAEAKAEEAQIARAQAEEAAAESQAREFAALSAVALGRKDIEDSLTWAVRAIDAYEKNGEPDTAARVALEQALGSLSEPFLLTFLDDPNHWAVFSPDGTRILTSSWDKSAWVADAWTGQQLVFLEGHRGPFWAGVFSPDGKRLLTIGEDNTARLWEAETGRELAALEGHSDPVTSAVFSPDGERILTASEDTTARLWETETGQELVILGHNNWLWSAVFSPEGERILTANWDHTAWLWEAETGRKLAVMEGHSGEVFSTVFSPDGERILTASRDNAARLWEAETGRELAILIGHTNSVNSAVFSPNGKRIVTASNDGTARIWRGFGDVEEMRTEALQRLLPFLTGDECRESELFDEVTCAKRP